MKASIAKLVSIGVAHAEIEATQDLEGLLATMEGEPTYQYFPVGKSFTGFEKTRRLYRHFIDEVQPRMVGHKLISESVGPQGVALPGLMKLGLLPVPSLLARPILSLLMLAQ